jgi:hypothetical protein
MLWDVKNKNSTKTIEGHASPVTAVASGSSDQLVLSAGQDKTLVLHSLSSSHSLQNTVNLSTKDTAEQGVISRLRFSVMDRAVAASASDSGCVCLWSVESQRLLHKFPSSGPATDLSFAQSNNKLLVSVGEDCKIHFLDTQQRKEVMLVSTPSPLSSVAILRDGYTVAAGGVDGKLYVYELRAMKSPKHVLEAHQGAITCIAEQNSVKSSRSSMKKAKKSAKESSRLSSLTPSDSPATPADPPNNQHTHPAPTTTTPSLETSPPPLPQQPPPLTLASHVVAPSSRVPTLPHQTPFPAGQRGSVQWGQFTTPAQTAGDKDSTGIFSPVDSTLSTPHPSSGASETGGSGAKTATATHQYTLGQQASSAGASSSSETRGRYPLASTFVSSTPAMQHPPLGMSGIFSPLDAPTPASLVGGLTTKNSIVGGPIHGVRGVEGERWQGPRNVPSMTPSASTPALSGVGALQPPPNPVAGGQSEGCLPITHPPSAPHTLPTNAAASSTSQTSLSSQLSSENDSSPLPPGDTNSPPMTKRGGSEVDGPETGGPLVSTQTSCHTETSPQDPRAVVQLPVVPEASSVHLQYLENLIRDSNEEMRLAVHRDIRALGLDMFRQFLMLQQQVGTAVSALHEKIDRLSEENKRLQEQLHQYAPNY